MKQYYIPTSSLNFNNIFSSESISPAAFYSQRGYGYSTWTSIPENNIPNAVLLYETPHIFVRPKGELEDHPMLVEIRTDEEFQQIKEGIYFSDHTIYLNPWNTRVFFFYEKDKVTALSLSESSSETKLLRLYKNRFQVNTFEGTYSTVEPVEIGLNAQAIEQDIKINRLKGLLYGYYIGAYKSVSTETVRLLHSLYYIQDTFAAILASPDRKASEFQVNSLVKALSVLKNSDEFYNKLLKIANSKDAAESILQLLQSYRISTPLDDYDVVKHLEKLRYSNPKNCYSFEWVSGQIAHIEKESMSSQNLLSPNAGEIIVTERSLATLKGIKDENLKKLLMMWANGILLSSKYNGKISVQGKELANDLTLAAKDFLSDEWESSPVRSFLNQLRHLLNGESIQLNWNQEVLASVAAVIYKGDDWEKLLRFMQIQEISNYRIALAIYGQLNGFSNLTRDFTDIILNQKESNYVQEFYTEIYGQLHGVKICKDPMPQLNEKAERKLPSTLMEKVLDYFESSEFDYRGKSKLLPELKLAIEKNGSNEIVQKFLLILSQQKGWEKKNKPYTLMAAKFTSTKREENELQFNDSEEQNTHIPSNTPNDVPKVQKVLLFVNDTHAYNVIESLLPQEESIRRQIEKDLAWFQVNYKESYKDENGKTVKGQYHREPTDNVSVIGHFSRYCRKMQTKGWWSADINIDSLIGKLNSYYND